MPDIAIANSKGRDACVRAQSAKIATRVRWLDADGRQAQSVRILKGTVELGYDALLSQYKSPEAIGEALLQGDPEIDLETLGSYLKDTSRVYIDSNKHPVLSVEMTEVLYNADGTEKLRRLKKAGTPNVNAEQPIVWTGKFLPKSEVFSKFVMVSKLQIFHVNGLTYDFLYEMAKDLEQRNSLMIAGAGPKGNQPIIFRRGAVPYRGFLEGRTNGSAYCLLLHLSNIELKAPEEGGES